MENVRITMNKMSTPINPNSARAGLTSENPTIASAIPCWTRSNTGWKRGTIKNITKNTRTGAKTFPRSVLTRAFNPLPNGFAGAIPDLLIYCGTSITDSFHSVILPTYFLLLITLLFPNILPTAGSPFSLSE